MFNCIYFVVFIHVHLLTVNILNLAHSRVCNAKGRYIYIYIYIVNMCTCLYVCVCLCVCNCLLGCACVCVSAGSI